MRQITPAKITMLCEGIYYGSEDIKNTEISSITTDSRNISSGGAFVAIKGEIGRASCRERV